MFNICFFIFFLKKYVWKYIIEIIEKREQKIQHSLKMVREVEKKIIDLKIYQDNIIKNAQIKRDAILKQAHDEKNQLEKETKKTIDRERENMMKKIKLDIDNEKINAIKYLKNYISDISINIAEKILKKELNNKEEHQIFINKLLNDLK